MLAALAQIRLAVAGGIAFVPATAQRTFSISGGDYAGLVVLPALIRHLREEAPGIDLRFRFIEEDAALACLDSGEIDLALGVFPSLPQRLASEPVLRERFVCLTARDHPAVAGPSGKPGAVQLTPSWVLCLAAAMDWLKWRRDVT